MVVTLRSHSGISHSSVSGIRRRWRRHRQYLHSVGRARRIWDQHPATGGSLGPLRMQHGRGLWGGLLDGGSAFRGTSMRPPPPPASGHSTSNALFRKGGPVMRRIGTPLVMGATMRKALRGVGIPVQCGMHPPPPPPGPWRALRAMDSADLSGLDLLSPGSREFGGFVNVWCQGFVFGCLGLTPRRAIGITCTGTGALLQTNIRTHDGTPAATQSGVSGRATPLQRPFSRRLQRWCIAGPTDRRRRVRASRSVDQRGGLSQPQQRRRGVVPSPPRNGVPTWETITNPVCPGRRTRPAFRCHPRRQRRTLGKGGALPHHWQTPEGTRLHGTAMWGKGRGRGVTPLPR